MSQLTIPALVTVVDLAQAFGLSESTLRRILRKRGIHPTARAAHVGVHDGATIARVRHAVNAELAVREAGAASDA